ncbi:hypothetical protein CLOP_g7142 [Closterium sp. NIES-67]|nr:hypothetical protein CLOP_g7142 [Closterium sp. NIES-67]
MDAAHAAETHEVLAHFHVDENTGLSDSQVEQSRSIYGRNEAPKEEGTPFWKLVLKQFDDLLVKILLVSAVASSMTCTPFWKLVLKQFDDLLVKILLVSAVVSFLLALANGESGWHAFVEPAVILLILIANATVGVVTETNAEKALEELKAYQADVATVLRNGRLAIIPAAELVPGDIVEVAVGGKVPADLRVLSLLSTQLRADQSILTGESGSVSKTARATRSAVAVYQDKTCILFAGTVVTVGRVRAIVIATGGRTAIGKIRDAISESADEMTPLKKKLDEFGTFLSKAIAVACILVWVINIRNFQDPAHGGVIRGAIYYFKIAVALAVAAIPEGLPAVVTTCLALGTKKMARLNAIVRSLPSVETLGCTTVICSDKTGTLTTNMMSVNKICVCTSAAGPLCELDVSGTTYAPEGTITLGRSVVERPADMPSVQHVAMCASMCNDSTLQYNATTDTYDRIGEATEVALRVLTEKIGLPGYSDMPTSLGLLSKAERASFCNNHWHDTFHKLASLEFSRDRKLMSVLCTRGEEEILFCKGAPEAVLSRSSRVLSNSDGAVAALTPELKAAIEERVCSYGRHQMLRCLALAMRPLPQGQQTITPDDEADLTFLGLVGMLDPPREEVRAAVETCRSAGIRIIVVTGDNKATAESVCRRIGLLSPLSSDALINIDPSSPSSLASPSSPSPPSSPTAALLKGGASAEAGGGTGGAGGGSGEGGYASLTASEFEQLSPSQKASAIQQLVLFCRVEPSHKSMLVDYLKRQNDVVAMTGDGVNDAPALKKADIGIAMGSGTAVAKGASDMVLADDNFSTIVAAVAEGRAIYNNMKAFIRYMVSSNIGEVVAIFLAAAVGMPETLIPVQLLWVNLVTDGLPATALGFNKQDRDVMSIRPRKMEDAIVNGWLFFRYLVIGIYVGLVTVAAFVWWYMIFADGPKITWTQLVTFDTCVDASGRPCPVFLDPRPRTVAMSVLVVVEMFNALNNLSENQSLLVLPPWSNIWLLAAIALSMILHFLILYVPALAVLFSVGPLSWPEWRAVLLFSFPVIIVDEILKIFSRNMSARPTKAKARQQQWSLLPFKRPKEDSGENHTA